MADFEVFCTGCRENKALEDMFYGYNHRGAVLGCATCKELLVYAEDAPLTSITREENKSMRREKMTAVFVPESASWEPENADIDWVDGGVKGDPGVYESVDHPDHYNWIPGIECMDVVKHMNFPIGNAMKYLWRAGRKPGISSIEDLKKAKFYIETEIERLEQIGQLSAEQVGEHESSTDD